MSKYKIDKTLINTYSEASQANPLRWEILHRVDEGAFKSQSGLIRCKDFFNELVRKYCSGQDSSIYRFDTKTLVLNDEGVYFRIHYIVDMGLFEANINSVINVNVDSSVHVSVEKLTKTTALLFIPRYYFNNTYLISLVTYAIRLCNVGKLIGTLVEACTTTADPAIQASGKALLAKWGFVVPEPYNKYWYYCGGGVNSEIAPKPTYTSIVHNNGVQSWSQYIKV